MLLWVNLALGHPSGAVPVWAANYCRTVFQGLYRSAHGELEGQIHQREILWIQSRKPSGLD